MKNARVLIVFMCVMATVNFTSADTIQGIDIDFVTIGNAGNAADTGGTPGCGAVSYSYRIGKYEVTNAQWDEFTAAAGAPTGNPITAYDNSATDYIDTDPPGAQQATNKVSWYETLQFCNYLTSGDKSLGAYQFSGNNANPGDFLGIDRDSAVSVYGTVYVVPTENEWYKAAYYKPDGSGYSTYANGTDTAPIAGEQSNYNFVIGHIWNVGVGTQEQNGTFDMMGNVWEWNETSFSLRGGSYGNYAHYGLASYAFENTTPDVEQYGIGFRVASIPEPATILLLTLGGLLLRKKRR